MTTSQTRPGAASRWQAALLGTTALALGLGAGHAVAGLISPASSPVLAIAGTVINLTPTPLKEWAVATLGTADKPLLVGGVILACLALGSGLGLLYARRPRLAMAAMAVAITLPLVAALLLPASSWWWAVPSLVAWGVGVAALSGVWRLANRANSSPVGPSRLARRVLLGGAAGSGALALAGGGLGHLLTTRTGPGDITLPRPGFALPPLPAGLEDSVPGLNPWVTPNTDFYRVDINLIVPTIDHRAWSLTIDGMVERPYQLGWDELIGMEIIERDITMTCVSNEVGGSYVGSARWLGVRTRDLLRRAGIDSLADQVLSSSVDGFTIGTPLAALLDERDALVAIGMNGRPLPPEHGSPARLVTPGLYGFVGATKWLTRLTVTTYTQQQAYWTRRGWAIDAPIKPSARIESPRPLQAIRAGATVIGGTAWAQRRGIAAVEVRIDSGPWRRAVLGPDAGIDFWRQWFLPWNATVGNHTLECRTIDATGTPQSDERKPPFPDGSSGVQQLVVIVR